MQLLENNMHKNDDEDVALTFSEIGVSSFYA